MPDLHVLVLAAGKGTRFKSRFPKVLHRVAGRSMIDRVVATAARLQPSSITLVVGHEADAIKRAVTGYASLGFVVQEPQLGTGHALLCAETAFKGRTGTLLLLSGDVPLLSAETLEKLLKTHRSAGAVATVLVALSVNPDGYGRIVRSGSTIAKIVEDRDATSAERQIREVNSGIYAFEIAGLFEAVHSIATDNAQREYYLPDLVAIYRRQGLGVESVDVSDPNEVHGINNRMELASVSALVRQRKNIALMAAGVTIEDPATTYIDDDVTVGPDTVIHPGVSLEQGTIVGADCEIHCGTRIVGSRVGDRSVVFNHCVINGSTIAEDAAIGPFAHLRYDVSIAAAAKVGNFVELKKTALGPRSKAMHLSYLGDATIGSEVNIGAGTITCNYDGTSKHPTTIASGAFIGSDSQLIAPVTVGEDAYVGTGTLVRENVPPGALAVSAGKQRNIEGWVKERRKRRGAGRAKE
ncbi:MAG: UDP-N-acetylglucosamine diphosphorylase/glucosamine-1-phosphate N-acetyltransferase [Acidobacteria bacterium]|nr:MAG: UDP-N-acetylglucosamine diphosphorylase/glucosamine-1-phosphate N-acetyltransferase [Acidobacteriota bacterium]PYR49358.1 MAG: UDP-N-acetylglucosamine diphosphorylase/glucosamine-1-phosphate N-acetyltransferase [Acidobacteriota bacterium]